ncbi:MAG: polyhydroxyalkanoate synthesis regulator phasin [Phycisphaerales bacterium]|jgi:polyhydroxyalkanoate synthesis regulator phasin
MNERKKIHQTPAALKQHAWKTPLSIASLALIAVVSVSSVNIDAIAEEPAMDANRTAPIDYTVNTFVKITDALIAGKITPEEAAQKIHTTNRVNTYLTKVETDISVAVESGKMTVDEGMEKYDAAVKNVNKRIGSEKGNNNERAQAHLKKIGTEIREAITNGDMTSEEGRTKYAEAEAKMQTRMGGEKGNNNERAQAHLKKIGTQIREAVSSGEMTPEEGKAKYAEAETRMQQRMGGAKNQNNDRAQAYLTKIGTEIKVAVANGELTSEEGKAKYLAAVEGIQKRMARASKGEQSERGAKDRNGNRDRDSKGKRGKDSDRPNK